MQLPGVSQQRGHRARGVRAGVCPQQDQAHRHLRTLGLQGGQHALRHPHRPHGRAAAGFRGFIYFKQFSLMCLLFADLLPSARLGDLSRQQIHRRILPPGGSPVPAAAAAQQAQQERKVPGLRRRGREV